MKKTYLFSFLLFLFYPALVSADMSWQLEKIMQANPICNEEDVACVFADVLKTKTRDVDRVVYVDFEVSFSYGEGYGRKSYTVSFETKKALYENDELRLIGDLDIRWKFFQKFGFFSRGILEPGDPNYPDGYEKKDEDGKETVLVQESFGYKEPNCHVWSIDFPTDESLYGELGCKEEIPAEFNHPFTVIRETGFLFNKTLYLHLSPVKLLRALNEYLIDHRVLIIGFYNEGIPYDFGHVCY